MNSKYASLMVDEDTRKGDVFMKISEVIRQAKSYYPSEYSDEEMGRWCDEVSAMLALEVEDEPSYTVSDTTLCDTPYDIMYIDYVIAKICLYQHDFNTYNQFISLFNTRLDAYKRWRMSSPLHQAQRLKNWW